jgi:UDP-2,3-diacylglucosamine hydrolase
MESLSIHLPEDQKIYFASDFHLGAPNHQESRKREQQIVNWLETIRDDAHAAFLVGDLFDFWFEYPHVIPKGFLRFQGKLASLADQGIPLHFFKGNHDMWMFDYFQDELGAVIHADNVHLKVNDIPILVGHGDGYGPGDNTYKVLKKIFRNQLAQFIFNWTHPNVGMWVASTWSGKSRIRNDQIDDGFTTRENEWLWQYCREVEQHQHHDFYIFGHRHLPLTLPVNEKATYFNLGEWVNHKTYGVFDGHEFKLETYNP